MNSAKSLISAPVARATRNQPICRATARRDWTRHAPGDAHGLGSFSQSHARLHSPRGPQSRPLLSKKGRRTRLGQNRREK